MKSNKGFTLIELIASFTLALTIMFFLFQIVIAVKELYVSAGLKTELLIKQANLDRAISADLHEKVIDGVEECGENCYVFYYKDGTSNTLKADETGISYGNYKMEALEGSKIGSIEMNRTHVDTDDKNNNAIMTIHISYSHKAFAEKDFGVYLVHQYFIEGGM